MFTIALNSMFNSVSYNYNASLFINKESVNET